MDSDMIRVNRVKRLAREVLAILFCGLFSASSAFQIAQADEILLEAAPISFPNPELAPANVIEFSYIFNQSGLEFLTDSATGDEIGGVFAQIVVFDSSSLPFDSTNQSFNVRKTADPDGSARIAGRLRLPLDPGRYTAALTVMDIVSKREATTFFQLPIAAAPTERLSISGIEIAHTLVAANGENAQRDPLVKNGQRVTPNPRAIYAADVDSLRMYVELYNLQINEAGKYRVGLRAELTDPNQEYPHILDERFLNAPGSAIVYARSFENTIQRSARSVLRFIVTDANSGITDTSLRRVTFLGEEPFATTAGANSGATVPYDTTSHKTRKDVIYWLLSPHQRDMMESLTLEGQSQFIERFWFDNDPDPTTAENKFRDDAYNRFMMANNRYSHSAVAADGWKRDPGRILMQYGLPDEVIDVPAPTIGNDITDYNPWERWNYDGIQGGVYFIFANERGYGEYRLRHSNAQGENFDRGIEEHINQTFRSSGG